MKITRSIVFFICLAVLFAIPLGRARADCPNTIFPPILIYDEDDLLEVALEDAGKYHGDVCLCLTIAFRATQLAISGLWSEEIPKRGDLRITTALPSPGSRDAFEFITRVVTRAGGNDFKLQLPTGSTGLSRANFTFVFERKSTGKKVRVTLKEGVFPEGYFEMRGKAKGPNPDLSSPVKKDFKRIKERLKNKLLCFWSPDKIFELEVVTEGSGQ